MTENEEENGEMNNPLPHILDFVRIQIRWGVLDIPRKIVRLLKQQGWKVVFWLMNFSMRKTSKNLEAVTEYFKFRDWAYKQIIKYMTENQGWVLMILRPEGKGMEKHWIQMSFVDPRFLHVETTIKEDGTRAVTSMEFVPSAKSVVQDWHIVNKKHLDHILKQEKFTPEVKENE